jgi:hypothetical protein
VAATSRCQDPSGLGIRLRLSGISVDDTRSVNLRAHRDWKAPGPGRAGGAIPPIQPAAIQRALGGIMMPVANAPAGAGASDSEDQRTPATRSL